MTIEYTSRPFFSEGDAAKQFLACITLSTHSVEFDAWTGKTYWFYVDERSHEDHALSVWESTDVGPHGERVSAKVNQLRISRRCALDWRYLHCLSPDGDHEPF